MRILLAGGGSGGSAAPVIAVAEAARQRDSATDVLYIGTTGGPEAAMVRAAGFRYVAIRAGRLRRYATWRNLTDPFLVLLGLGQAMGEVARFRPHVAFAAGGFATVPPLLAARVLGVPIVIHQQDAAPGLANRMLAPFASRITLALPGGQRHFGAKKTVVVGNPARSSVLKGDAVRARVKFGIPPGTPVVLVTGGGTGALRLNQIAQQAAQELVDEAFVLHLTGAGKTVGGWEHPHYQQHEFLASDMADALAVAAVVVTRAGMSALTEIGALEKPAIVVPMPHSHQEENARIVGERGAGVVLSESDLTPEVLLAEVRGLLRATERAEALGHEAGQLLDRGAADVVARLLADVARLPR